MNLDMCLKKNLSEKENKEVRKKINFGTSIFGKRDSLTDFSNVPKVVGKWPVLSEKQMAQLCEQIKNTPKCELSLDDFLAEFPGE